MSEAVTWEPEAAARLKEIPFFVRPIARKKIEKFVQEEFSSTTVTLAIYE
ncbi:PCP reductase family protein [Trichothermofontia sp.]